MFEIPLNKFEKEKKVIELHKQGKTIRQIAPEVHMSFRDISRISKSYDKKIRLQQTKKEQENNQQPKTKKLSLSSRAFILFRKGKKTEEVKVLLDIPFKKAMIFWKQYLQSISMEDCYEFYQVFQKDLPILLSITYFMKRNNISGNNIVNILRESKNVINLNRIISNLKAEIEKLEQIKKDYSFQILPPIQPLPRYPSSWNGYYY